MTRTIIFMVLVWGVLGGMPVSGATVTGLTAVTDMGELTALTNMLNRSGLNVPEFTGTHDGADSTTWKSTPGVTAGSVTFNLNHTYLLRSIAVWNSSQLAGDRGVSGVSIQTSLDGSTYTSLATGPTQFLKRSSAPVSAELFSFQPLVARHARFNIASGHGAVNTGIGEVMFFGEPTPPPIQGVTATTDMGELTALTNAINGSGLNLVDFGGLHDGADSTTWKSTPGVTAGSVTFNLNHTYLLRSIAVWNSSQLAGDRGVSGVTIRTSVHGTTYSLLAGAPTSFTKRTAAPVAAEVFTFDPVEALYVRFDIASGYGAVNIGLGEVMFGGSRVVSFSQVVLTNAPAFRFSTELGETYELRQTLDLLVPSWSPLGFTITGNGAEMFAFDPTGLSSQKFYRIVIGVKP